MADCILCHTAAQQPWSVQELVTWWRCPHCGLFYVDPQPDEATLDELYHRAYWGRPLDPEQRGEDSERCRWSARVFAVTRLHTAARLLDVGCGKGEFLKYAALYGWDGYGTEVDAAAVKALPAAQRKKIHIGRLETMRPPKNPFDVITMWDVIEHVRDPVEFLKAAHAVVKPGGLLAITTPNPRTWKNRLRGPRCKYFDFARYLHLYHFTHRTLETTFRAAGFEPVRWLNKWGTPLFLAGKRV